MKFYFAPGACSLASRIVLEELGVTYESKRLSLREGDQRKPEYLKVNPKAKVPALEVEGGQVLTENPAIMSYLADTHPEGKLLGAVGSLERARAQEWLAWCASTVHPSFSILFGPGKLIDGEAAQAELLKKVRANTQKLLDDFDHALTGRAYVLGDRFSIADAYTLVFFNWASHLGLKAGPAHAACAERLRARPGVQRAIAAEAPPKG